MPPSLPRLRLLLAEQLAESERRPLPNFTARSVSPPVRFPGKVTAVVGMRRAGKTTFLHQLRSESVERGVPLRRLPYISFDDERLADLGATQLGLLVDEYYRRSPESDRGMPVAWHFDEIQLVRNWERFVRRLLDSEQTEIAVTGSSAALLSSEIATTLREESIGKVLARSESGCGTPILADPAPAAAVREDSAGSSRRAAPRPPGSGSELSCQPRRRMPA